MKNVLTKNLKRAINLLEYPELMGAKRNHIHTGFVKDLLFIKKKLNIIPKTVLDIGAAIGTYTKAANYILPNAQIYAFEPIPESFQKLESVARASNDKVKPFNIALDIKNGENEFYLNDFSFSSSLLKMSDIHKNEFPFTKNEKKITVACRRLDKIEEIEIKQPCLVKMDVQGAELRVLEGAGGLIGKFDVIQLEVNFEKFYYGQAEYDKIFSYMIRNGFNRFIQVDPLYSKTGVLLASDLVFFK